MMLAMENATENFATAITNHVNHQRITWFAEKLAQAQQTYEKVKSQLQADPAKLAPFEKEIEQVVRATQIKNPRALQASKGIDQIERFREYTNNFTNLDILTPEEVMYLNLCEWLEPKAKKINNALKAQGGLKVVDPKTGAVQAVIEEFDLFHSLLGEMSPNALANRVKGGHLYIPEL